MSSRIGQPDRQKPSLIRPVDIAKPLQWHFTILSGKLKGLVSVTTAATCAPFCRSRHLSAVDDDICSKCYATSALSTFRASMLPALERNRKLLARNVYVVPTKWPAATALRLMSHGDASSVRECVNAWKLAADSPYAHVAMWTKNADAVAGAVAAWGKPARLQLVYSSPKIGVRASRPSAAFDRVFTVYRDHVPADAFACPGACADCLVCYTLNDVVDVGILLHR
jgi:hypothetical protein